MNDTPRTNGLLEASDYSPELSVMIDYAMKLERELNAEKESVSEHKGCLKVMCEKYDADRTHYNNRINRLEEAGDELMRWRADVTSAANWIKAKEAKP